MSFSTAQMDNNHQNDTQTMPLLHRMQLTPVTTQAAAVDNMSTLKMRMACNGSNPEAATTNMPVEIKILNTEHNNHSTVPQMPEANDESVTVTYSTAKDFAANYFANKMQIASSSQLNHEHVHEALKDHKLHVENLLVQSKDMQCEQELHAEALMDHKQHAENNNRAIQKLSTTYNSLDKNVQAHTAQIAELQSLVKGTNKAVSQHKRLIEQNMATHTKSTRAWS